MHFHLDANQSHFHKNGLAMVFETEAQVNSEMAHSNCKKMAAVHFTTIRCEPILTHWAYRKIWFNGSRSYTNSIALVEFE